MAHERGPVLSGIAPTVLGMRQRRNTELLEQLTWHWTNQLRPRLDGLTDEEYLWEPVPGAWNVRPRGQARTEQFGGSGDVVVEFAYPEPTPAPLTTIAWRLAHVIVGVFGMRNAAHFGGRRRATVTTTTRRPRRGRSTSSTSSTSFGWPASGRWART
jgi:hypothetical protein